MAVWHAGGSDELPRADLESARLEGIRGDATTFLGSHATSVRFDAVRLTNANFLGADLQLSTFLFSTLSTADLTGADLTGATMTCLAAPDANFTGAISRRMMSLAAKDAPEPTCGSQSP